MKRIPKRAARRYVAQGIKVYMIPRLMNVRSLWTIRAEINPLEDFDKQVMYFEYYNCNAETGRYSSFYLDD